LFLNCRVVRNMPRLFLPHTTPFMSARIVGEQVVHLVPLYGPWAANVGPSAAKAPQSPGLEPEPCRSEDETRRGLNDTGSRASRLRNPASLLGRGLTLPAYAPRRSADTSHLPSLRPW
jgi:hypothetical protein